MKRAVAALSHQNIIALHDVGHDGATAYVVMELLDGASLRTRLAEGFGRWKGASRRSAISASLRGIGSPLSFSGP